MTASTLGAAIRTARQQADMTQAQLADACLVTQPAVAHWEAGRITPGRQSLSLITATLGPLT